MRLISAGEFAEHEVEDDEVVIGLLHILQRFFAGKRDVDVTDDAEGRGKYLGKFFVVFHYEKSHDILLTVPAFTRETRLNSY